MSCTKTLQQTLDDDVGWYIKCIDINKIQLVTNSSGQLIKKTGEMRRPPPHNIFQPPSRTKRQDPTRPCPAEASFTSMEVLHVIWSNVGCLAGLLFADLSGPFISQYVCKHKPCCASKAQQIYQFT